MAVPLHPYARRAGARLRAVLPDRATLATMGRSPRKDLFAGLTVAIVALPLALGFGVASGAGAEAGLATAVVAGALAAFFGGSNLQVSGPTGAMTVVLVPIVHRYGTTAVLTVGLMSGVLLIAAALGGAGRFMAYVPAPVVEGFTVGIAGVIGLQQVPAALGVPASGAPNVVVAAADAVVDFARTPHPAALALAAAVAAAMLIGARLRPGIPFSLLAVVAATVVTGLAGLDVATIGHLPAGLPAPSLGFLHPGELPHLATAALAVAALAALESLMSATAADAMSVSERHDSDRELFGQGIANLVAPLFGGVAATGAIARTAVNVRSGAASRLAALVHAAVLAVVVFAAAPLVAGIPLAALAGVLIATAVRMVEVASLRALARSGRGEAAVLVLTAGATLAFDLVTAVLVGLLVAGALALRQVARSAALTRVPLHEGLPPADHHAEEQALLAEHIVAYRIDGPLFFAGAHRFLLELAETTDVKAVILRLSRVSTIDATGALVLGDAIAKLERRGILVLVSGVRADHLRTLDALGVLDALRADGRVFPGTPGAIAHARHHLNGLPAATAGPATRAAGAGPRTEQRAPTRE
ncbi:SulP family inorganic anion transporter [Kitasatospora sp. NPDC127111]|uniref:SulP family inorganic anion transporter n=1 Tax=Kitasatospora sp. NPDC127111 TaxID=3345363 RepID=UPI00362A3034